MLFLRIRKNCIISEEKQKMLDEIYWLDGFIFHYLNEINEKIENSNLLEMKTIQKQKNRKDTTRQQIIQIKISTNENPQFLFQNIHISVKEFISQWMVEKYSNQIHYQTKKMSTEKEDNVNFRNELKGDKVSALCSFCGHDIFFNEHTIQCEMCGSKNFLIEGQFALLKVVAQGGFGR
jgi:hypothetical protein